MSRDRSRPSRSAPIGRVLGFDFSNVYTFRTARGVAVFTCVNCRMLVANSVTPYDLPLCVTCKLDGGVRRIRDKQRDFIDLPDEEESA